MYNNRNKSNNDYLSVLLSSIDNLIEEQCSKKGDQMIKQRVELNRLKNTLQEMPTLILYGESNVGKSYLLDAILSDDKVILHKIIFKILQNLGMRLLPSEKMEQHGWLRI